MKKKNTQTTLSGGRFTAALALVSLLLVLFAGGLAAQNPWPDYDFKAANSDGDTLYYRITSSSAPYTAAVTRCHDSVFHTLPLPQYSYQVGQPGFLYPVYDYDTLITIPSSVTYGGRSYTVNAIDKEAFYYQKGMHTVVLPASVETIDSGAFYGSSLHQIVMSPNVKRIHYYAFMNTPLESIDLPSGLIYIGKEAFAYSSLTEVDVPASVTVLPYEAFFKCPLTKITLHEGLQEIQENAFSANLIDSLFFPGSLHKIALNEVYFDEYDTVWCRYVEFKNGTNSLELADNCFLGFTHLDSVVLSDNITRIGSYCFGQTALHQVVIPPLIDTVPEGCFAYCHSLSSVTLPENLKVIGKLAFGGTPMLKEISIPASVTFIGQRAFYVYSANGLEVINCYAEVPPFIDGVDGHSSFSKSDTLYVRVPCGTTAAYQSAPGWNQYGNLVYQECVGVEDYMPEVFKVYPNPVGDVVYIELRGAGIANVTLYDLQGRVVGANNYSPLQGTATTTLNVRNVPAGMYVLRVRDAEGKEYRQKVLKN